MKQIEFENRAATPDEQKILARYVGWGGISQAFDEKNESWKKEYNSVKDQGEEAEITLITCENKGTMRLVARCSFMEVVE